MVKKIVAVGLVALGLSVSLFAATDALYGDSVFELSDPKSLTRVSSVSGGGIFNADCTSLITNPALTAHNQRVGLNLAGTVMVGVNDMAGMGGTIQAGILVPFKWGVVSGLVDGLFPLSEFGATNSLNIKGSVSKEISDKLSIGAGLNTGLGWGNGADWALSANLGFLYEWGQLGFVQDFRFAGSVLNLGKNYGTPSQPGFLNAYPGFATIKAGASGLLLSNDLIKIGASMDLTTPCFLNLITDIGVNMSFKNLVYLNVNEKLNVKELVHGKKDLIPSVSVLVNFKFETKKIEYLNKNDWSQSEMMVSAAYKNVYKNVHIGSVAADISLGMKDTTPPVIQLWLDEEDE